MQKVILLITLSYLASLNIVRADKVSASLKRQSLIYHEPPVEGLQIRKDEVTEHHIIQRLDNFNHQNKQTFRMVSISSFSIHFYIMYFTKLLFLALSKK